MNGSLKLPPPPAATAAEGDVSATLYLTAQRWRSYLLEHSVAFRRLQEERERGWRSAALDEWYARRQADTTRSLATSATVASPSRLASELAVKRGTQAGEGTTAFVNADVTVLAERYRQHARRITQHVAGAFFRAAPKVNSSESSTADEKPVSSAPLFLDLGCAPGGVSKYLVEDLGWRGVGVTLARADGGIEMDPLLLRKSTCGDASFVLLDGDVTQPPSTWNRSAACALMEGESCATEMQAQAGFGASSAVYTADVLPLSASLFKSNSAAAPRFHFVNGGAVLDHGQRQRRERAEEVTLASASVLSGGVMLRASASGGADYVATSLTDSSPSACAQAAAPILPWFSLLVPQLKTALTYVATGGALMLVHGAPHCASMFILMRCMEEVVGVAAGTPTSASRGRVHVLETMHLAKAPVYLLWTGVRPPRKDLSDGAEARALQDAQTCLLEALSTTSPRIFPLCRTTSSTPSITATGDSRALLREKQRLWLGESDEGFELAVDGFQRYGHLVEVVWGKMEAFLRQRRERAEREVHSGGGDPRRNRRAAPTAGLKRMRSDG
ncbi:conserved hypothetical protein [Leishmania major strain Friedlin]|uniref:Ribosomal RNA methyltransferase FtsJ domain-containing protein n=1 Tax=Leishmania major TaxID=5664 RepID=Q4Q8X7_LEIMA|nr:conserved hypothetical protein [Leishmania major strain Friedlin]CAG9576540.1 FtsJ-like_methyltransferase_-_putative [Leishmania major strain Friedlin]CAJ05532.1 conserved hypothetical protein [Leishmania major strain Friedlin]|eukprot:XP_001684221.1 conserved hypothetical protein [Leishmania major strain Friedlin]